LPRIPLIEDLTLGPIPIGSILMVEYDPASAWYAACSTIAAGWLATGGRVQYNLGTRLPVELRSRLGQLGLDTEQLEKNEKLIILDWYTASLAGQKSKEKYAFDTLKVADLSIRFLKAAKGDDDAGIPSPASPDILRLLDDGSLLARFNDEKSLIEFFLARFVPAPWKGSGVSISGIMRGVHSDWFYRQLEAQVDGIVDFRLDESGEEPNNLMRIRNMRSLKFHSQWHHLTVTENFEVAVDK